MIAALVVMVKSQESIKEETVENLTVVEEEEDDEVTRCVCGETDPPDDSGLYIQCEQCSVWQHGYCVGITEGEDSAPDKYWCEQCKPELHSLYTTDLGEHRSIYKPVQQRKRQNRRSRREEESQTDATEGEDSTVAADTTSAVEDERPRKRHQRRKAGQAAKIEPDEEKRSLDRKRATSSAREEKQYQLMLEKALKESRRTSQPDEEPTNPGSAEEAIREEAPARRSKSGSASGTPATSSEDDSRRRARRGTQRKPRNRGSSYMSSNESSSGSTSDIGITKPVKPRIPTQKTTLNEMRRRVSAILEFISRTQLELSQDQMEKNQLVEFVENEAFIQRVETIFNNYDNSLKIMDDLTRTLLLWEKKYACEQTS